MLLYKHYKKNTIKKRSKFILSKQRIEAKGCELLIENKLKSSFFVDIVKIQSKYIRISHVTS